MQVGTIDVNRFAMSHQQIADVLGITRQRVAAIEHRALRKLGRHHREELLRIQEMTQHLRSRQYVHSFIQAAEMESTC